MTAAEILARLDSAFKSITVTDLGDSVLQPTKFDQFIRTAQNKTTVLPEARFVKMLAQQADVDRVGFTGRILKSGYAVDGTEQDAVLATHESKPTFATNKLIAKEMFALASIKDTTLRRNIEKEGFESTLVDLFGEAAGRDYEEFALLADVSITYANDDVLHQTDGWLAKAGSKLYGTAGPGGAAQFDIAAETYPENLFGLMLDTLPKQYLGDIRDWRYYVNWATYSAYRNLLKARGTDLGDRAVYENIPLLFEGISIRYCPLLERSKTVVAGGKGRPALLVNPDNMAWGIFHEITIEPDRIPKGRRTDFVLTLEGDVHYEDEDAAVAAYYDVPRPA